MRRDMGRVEMSIWDELLNYKIPVRTINNAVNDGYYWPRRFEADEEKICRLCGSPLGLDAKCSDWECTKGAKQNEQR